MAKRHTLTDARTASRILGLVPADSTTCRNVPYGEIYRRTTVLIESPVDYLQRAAEDDELRRSERDATGS